MFLCFSFVVQPNFDSCSPRSKMCLTHLFFFSTGEVFLNKTSCHGTSLIFLFYPPPLNFLLKNIFKHLKKKKRYHNENQLQLPCPPGFLHNRWVSDFFLAVCVSLLGGCFKCLSTKGRVWTFCVIQHLQSVWVAIIKHLLCSPFAYFLCSMEPFWACSQLM